MNLQFTILNFQSIYNDSMFENWETENSMIATEQCEGAMEAKSDKIEKWKLKIVFRLKGEKDNV